MDRDGRDVEAVFFGRLESEEHGIQHTGDNLTGEGEGDDEQIIINLDNIGDGIKEVFLVVNIYTPQRSFMQVAEPFCRIVDNSSGSELCRYALRDAGSESGLIIAKIAREVGGRRLGGPRGRQFGLQTEVELASYLDCRFNVSRHRMSNVHPNGSLRNLDFLLGQEIS